jgi:uncharacterized membrane protein
MGGRKSKFIFLLIAYFAGFATAIYCLAPSAGQNEIEQAGKEILAESACKSEQFAQSFNSKMHIVLDYAKGASKGASRHLGRFIKQQIKQQIDEKQIDENKMQKPEE